MADGFFALGKAVAANALPHAVAVKPLLHDAEALAIVRVYRDRPAREPAETVRRYGDGTGGGQWAVVGGG